MPTTPVCSASYAAAPWPSRSEYRAETFQRRTGSFLLSQVLARATAGRIPKPSRMDSFMNVTLSDRVILFSISLMLLFPPLAQRSVSPCVVRSISKEFPELLWMSSRGDGLKGSYSFCPEQGMTFLDGRGVPRGTAFTITSFVDGLSTRASQ
jgi:hypothetical protein